MRAKIVQWSLSLVIPLIVGATSGYTTAAIKTEHRFTVIEQTMLQIKAGLEQQMEGYKIQNAEIARLNKELREELNGRLNRIDNRLDYLMDYNKGRR